MTVAIYFSLLYLFGVHSEYNPCTSYSMLHELYFVKYSYIEKEKLTVTLFETVQTYYCSEGMI